MHGRTSYVRHEASGLFEGVPVAEYQVVRYHSLVVEEGLHPSPSELADQRVDREFDVVFNWVEKKSFKDGFETTVEWIEGDDDVVIRGMMDYREILEEDIVADKNDPLMKRVHEKYGQFIEWGTFQEELRREYQERTKGISFVDKILGERDVGEWVLTQISNHIVESVRSISGKDLVEGNLLCNIIFGQTTDRLLNYMHMTDDESAYRNIVKSMGNNSDSYSDLDFVTPISEEDQILNDELISKLDSDDPEATGKWANLKAKYAEFKTNTNTNTESMPTQSGGATQLPSCLRATAWAEDDNTVMAMEHTSKPLYGVQVCVVCCAVCCAVSFIHSSVCLILSLIFASAHPSMYSSVRSLISP
jgi:anthranilate/para-aminobenzoate synthase component II